MNPDQDDQTNTQTTDPSTPSTSALFALSQDPSQQGNSNSNPDAAVNPNMGVPGPSGMGPISPMMSAAMRFLNANQSNNTNNNTNSNGGIQTQQIGPFGTHILQTNSPGDRVAQMNNTITSGLNGLAQSYIQDQQMQNRQSFIQSVHQIMGTNAPQQDKMNALLDLQDAHGTDYGVGLNKIAQTLGLNKQAPQSPAQQLQQLMQLAQSNPDQAHTQATSQLGANYQTKYPQLATAINNGANNTVMGMANQALQKVYGPNMQIDPVEFAKSGKIVPTPNQPVSNDPNYSTLAPDQALQKLQASNPSYADYLQMYASGQGGKISASNRSPQQQKLMQDLAFFYPNINVDNINQRVDTLKDFSSGNTSKNILAYNTALGHLNTLNDLSTQVDNKGMPITNAINQAGENTFGYGNAPALKQFNMTKTALSGELATVFKNTGGTDTEINNIAKEINSADTPAMLQAVTKTSAGLMASRLQAIQGKWSNTYNGPNDQSFPVLTPTSQAILKKLGVLQETPQSVAAGGQGGQPPQNNQPKDFSSLWTAQQQQ
jgi:hypothetical protein